MEIRSGIDQIMDLFPESEVFSELGDFVVSQVVSGKIGEIHSGNHGPFNHDKLYGRSGFGFINEIFVQSDQGS